MQSKRIEKKDVRLSLTKKLKKILSPRTKGSEWKSNT